MSWPHTSLVVLWAVQCVACESESRPEPLHRDCSLRVSFEPGALRGTAVLEATFGTNPEAATSEQPMTLDADGRHFALIEGPPGPVRYRIRIGDQRFTDAENPLTDLDPKGQELSYADLPDCDRPALTLAEREDVPGGVNFSLRLLRARSGAALAAETVVARLDGRPVKPSETWDDALAYTLGDLSPGKHHFTVSGQDETGVALESFSAPFWVSGLGADAFRWEDAVVYQIVTDRFAAEQAFTDEQRARPLGQRIGGNLRGVKRVVESGYFAELGVNTLWISPLSDNPEDLRVGREGGAPKYVGYHGYWPAADRALEPAFGDEADVDGLVASAHAQGLRVIMDVVLNHVDVTHPLVATHPEYFRRPACVCGSAKCPWSTHIESCWFTPYLPDVDWRTPGALEHQLDTAMYFMERFDLDGLRLDAVPMMPRLVTRRLEARVRQRFEGLRERHLLLGETYTGSDEHDLIRWYLGPRGLDSQFDFPLMWTLRETLTGNAVPLTHLADELERGGAAWAGSTAVMATMIGNHDVPRYIESVGDVGDRFTRARFAHAAVLALPGMPIMYYGDELGFGGAYDPANRAPMRFRDDWTPQETALHDDVARLGRLRACLPSLRRGTLVDLQATADTITWRRTAGDGRDAIFALNRAPGERTIDLLGADDTAFAAAFGAGEIEGHVARLPGRTVSVFLPEGDVCLRGGAE